MTFLAYDVRGIQSFVFAVPRLRYVIGGSALIDRFDHDDTDAVEAQTNACKIFSGGGKGVFDVPDAIAVEPLRNALVQTAHRVGLDLRIGISDNYSDAVRTADQLFPYLPPSESLDAHPCEESGLYPQSPSARGPEGRALAEVIARRVFDRGERLARRFEEKLLPRVDHPLATGSEATFFRDVDPRSDDGRRGARVLGGRNRWAVIAMDGNGLGLQFRHAAVRDLEQRDLEAHRAWIARLAPSLAEVTIEACAAGIGEVVKLWARDEDPRADDAELVLPVRPLIVGGDDLVLLCHSRYALDFVQRAAWTFEESSARMAKAAARDGLAIDLWPASGNRLSISAGVLFAPVSLPLASAIPYAETLLGLAKRRGRRSATADEQAGRPAPACVEWETVTEGLLDHPERRRLRSLVFHDGDDQDRRVELTRRPYTIEELDVLRNGAQELFTRLPASVAHQLPRALRAGRDDREVTYARLAKNRGDLAAELRDEDGGSGSPLGWTLEDGVRRLGLLDALDLAREERRLEWETAEVDGR